MTYLYLTLLAVAAFILSFIFYTYVKDALRLSLRDNYKKFMFLPLVAVFMPLLMALPPLTDNFRDTLFLPSLELSAIVLLSALLIGCSDFIKYKNVLRVLMCLSCAGACVYMLPEDYRIYNMDTFTTDEKLIVWGLWSLLAIGYPILGASAGLEHIHTIMIMLAFCLFYALSIVPMYMLGAAILMIAFVMPIFMIEMSENEKIFNTTAMSVMGFIFGWISVVCAGGEGILLPTEIMLTYLEVEVAFWVFKRLIMREKSYKTMMYFHDLLPMDNTERMMYACVRTESLLIILALMQVYSIQSQALPIFAVFAVLWAMGKLGASRKNQSLSEINKEFVADLKKGISEVTDVFGNKKK